MIRHIRENPKSTLRQTTITAEEETLIRLAALLHDVPHIPFGHTLEDELRVLPRRHDDDPDRRNQLITDSPIGQKLRATIGQDQLELLTTIMEAKHSNVHELGAHAFISDVVNNTVCADLLDYLKRDVYHCGLKETFGDRFLKYLYLEDVPNASTEDGTIGGRRVVVRLWKHEKSRHRRDVLSELVELLRVRYSLGERVYFHHAKISSSAMISRAVWSAMHADHTSKLRLEQLYSIGDDQLLALLETFPDPVASRLASGLLSRQLYKRIYTLPRPQAADVLYVNWPQKMVDEFHMDPANRTHVEDQLADLCGLDPGDVLIYCADLDMAKKYARMLVEWKGEHKPLKDIEDPAITPALDAILKSHAQLWGLHVFLSPRYAEDERVVQTLRGLCYWRFAAADHPADREGRLSSVLRTIVNHSVGLRGTAEQSDRIVDILMRKHRGVSADDLSLNLIHQTINDVIGQQP
jgi:HD superfamily phosphohydrolase